MKSSHPPAAKVPVKPVAKPVAKPAAKSVPVKEETVKPVPKASAKKEPEVKAKKSAKPVAEKTRQLPDKTDYAPATLQVVPEPEPAETAEAVEMKLNLMKRRKISCRAAKSASSPKTTR